MEAAESDVPYTVSVTAVVDHGTQHRSVSCHCRSLSEPVSSTSYTQVHTCILSDCCSDSGRQQCCHGRDWDTGREGDWQSA
jgi:hypothetical protein